MPIISICDKIESLYDIEIEVYYDTPSILSSSDRAWYYTY